MFRKMGSLQKSDQLPVPRGLDKAARNCTVPLYYTSSVISVQFLTFSGVDIKTQVRL